MLLISSSDRHLSFVIKGCCNYLNGYELRSMGMLELQLMLPKPNISLLYWFSQISNGAEKSIHLNLLICDCWMYIHLPLCLHARDNISKKTDNIVSLVQKVLQFILFIIMFPSQIHDHPLLYQSRNPLKNLRLYSWDIYCAVYDTREQPQPMIRDYSASAKNHAYSCPSSLSMLVNTLSIHSWAG